MASDATGTRSVHNTLTGTTVDIVTLQGHWGEVEVSNRVGSDPLWVAVGKEGDTVADPVAAANETFYVPAGTTLTIPLVNGATVRPLVKILGNDNEYSVVGN